MATSSSTIVFDNTGKKIIDFYGYYDGYPSDYGLELAEFLLSFEEITNGIKLKENRKVANGMFCLAAQLVANFKKGVGEFYLYPPENKMLADYSYQVYQTKVVVNHSDRILFSGSWENFYEFCLGDE
jgi:hypothetical protein